MSGAHSNNHDYHLVDPSPWPLVGSICCFITALGGIMWMKSMTVGGLHAGPVLFGAGFIGILYTMLSWWSDVVNEAEYGGYHTRVVQISHRYGMIMFIASEVMFFVAWFWAFFDASLYAGEIKQYLRVEYTGGHWPPKGIEVFDPWHLPLLNTLILLLSGTTVTWAHHALLENDRNGLKWGLILTCALGALFTGVQIFEYQHAAFAFKSSIYGATFFMATGFHGFHVLIGTIFLIVCLVRALKGH
ncbi:MAG: cytochrome c oxidase subunit 3, partial [Hyphomicrobiales bacterium]|nr:cytochrome c oxidase subunit 3 [Hyphomicrobiales bacterium]